MTMFTEKFTQLWGEATDSPVDKNHLCGVYYGRPDGRVEIVWRPETPSTHEEQTARRIFRSAIELAARESSDETEVDRQEFLPLKPTVGHLALRVFCDHQRLLRDFSQVATIRPYVPDELIG